MTDMCGKLSIINLYPNPHLVALIPLARVTLFYSPAMKKKSKTLKNIFSKIRCITNIEE